MSDRSKIDEDEFYHVGDAVARFYAVLDGIPAFYDVLEARLLRVFHLGLIIFISGDAWEVGAECFRGCDPVSFLFSIGFVVLIACGALMTVGMKDNGDWVSPLLETTWEWLWFSFGPLMLITMVAMFIFDPPLR